MINVLRAFWSHIALAGVTIMLLFTRGALEDARETIQEEKDFREILRQKLHLKSADMPTVAFGIDLALQESEARRQALEEISVKAEEAKARADAADAALRRAQAVNERRFEAVRSKIEELQARESTGDLAKDMEIIARDSALPWKGWK